MISGSVSAASPVLVLCADDFAFTRSISIGIAELIRAGRLTATSCMTVIPNWPRDAELLSGLELQAEIGLHLTLTDESPLTNVRNLAPSGHFPKFQELARDALLRRLPTEELSAELEAQVDRFEQVAGRLPAYLDGHQHIQQLPQVRDAVIDLYNRRLRGTGAYIRNAGTSPTIALRRRVFPGRALAIGMFGSSFRRRVVRADIPTNSGFAGIYDFSDRRTYRELFRQFLVFAEPGTILMCHPGKSPPTMDASDRIARARVREFEYFSGKDFPNDLSEAGVRLGRLSTSFEHLGDTVA